MLAQPNNPPLLTWAPSAGATTYKVEVDGDADFVGASASTTANTSLVVPLNLGDGDWFWRVTRRVEPQLAPQRGAPFPGLRGPRRRSPRPRTTRPRRSRTWCSTEAPLPGAASYDIQVSTEADFSQGAALIDTQTGVLGTRYAPQVTYDNASYFWRVRAIDMSGQATPWTAARFSFTRIWPHRPTAVFPAADGAEDVPASLYFQWTSIPHASEYEFQLGTQPNFTVGTFASCRVAGTTYTPGMFAVNTTGILAPPRNNEDCIPQAGEMNYWRVRGLDRPFTKGGDIPGVQGLFSEAQAFRYMPLSVTNMSPRNGAVVDVPTLTWDTVTGAEPYKISIHPANGSQIVSRETYATSYTLDGTNRPRPVRGAFHLADHGAGCRPYPIHHLRQRVQRLGQRPHSAQPALTPLTPTTSTTGHHDGSVADLGAHAGRAPLLGRRRQRGRRQPGVVRPLAG